MGSEEPTIAQDGSIFNLTLDEVQSQLDSLGKPLSSMNLEELMKTVRTADSNKVLGTENDLSAKTVSEVWRNIQQGHTENNSEDRTTSCSQSTLGELTLEDFLAKAGIVAEAPTVEENNRNISNNAHNGLLKSAPWTQVQHCAIQQPVCQPPMLQCTNMVPVFLPGHHHAHQSLPMATTYPQTQTSLSSPQSVGSMSDTPSLGRKRIAMGDIDDKPAAERRHRRMIKNRESAARSRERKQAYTQQLELKLAELEEENKKLKADEAPTPRALPPDTKHQLRRTGSTTL